jgi:GTP-binding protein
MAQAEIQKNDLPTVALIGRVNVGKSSLFNRLIEQQKAIVSPIPGTTRTNNEGIILWRGKQINIIDTGGLTFSEKVQFEKDIIKQTEYAIKEADIIVFLTDATTGILPQERELAKRLRKTQKTVLLVANKVDNEVIERELLCGEWMGLGFGEPIAVSAANGRLVGEFLDRIYNLLNKKTKRPKSYKQQKESVIKISIIGKPNVGKSSLFNKLIGQEKVIVSDIAHTTREPHDTTVAFEHEIGSKKINQKINFIDTAGIRRKANVEGHLEKYGISKSISAIEESDIVLFIIDASESISSQDKQLAGLVEKRGKSVIIILNKWDLSDDNSDRRRKEVVQMIEAHFPHLNFAPIVFASGLTGYKVHQIFPLIMRVWNARHVQIPDSTLEIFLKQITKTHLPSKGKGTRQPSLVGIRQIGIAPPVMEIFVKHRTSVHPSYINFIENKIRMQFDFIGAPVIIKLRKMKK